MRVVVLGMMGRTPFAGVAWQVLHYLEGFRRAGCDVFYVEDTGSWPYDPEQNTITDNPAYTVRYVAALMEWVGLPNGWSYAGPDGTTYGLPGPEVARLLASADALVNLTGATVLRDEHMVVPVRLYVETDPVLPQIEVALGREFTIDLLAAHTHHVTFGENVGRADCPVPVGPFAYRPTRQPVVVDWWTPDSRSRGRRFTTVATWRQSGRDVVWRGDTYTWSKHHEFNKVIDLPKRTSEPLELALACDDAETLATLRRNGWTVVDALQVSRDLDRYRSYILGSRGEFTVAKDQNVRLRSGWFSDRSACYLAAGKPVVTQDTGFGDVIPTGEGLFAFSTVDEAGAALDAIAADYARHAAAARALAEEYFDAQRVVGRLLADVGVAGGREAA